MMDEQRTWIKSRRKRHLRMLAAALAFCLLLTTYPDILATLSAFAAGIRNGGNTVYVSGFAELPEEVQEQMVPVGTEAEALKLPDTLKAFMTVKENISEDKENVPAEEENPDGLNRKEEDETGAAGTETGAGADGTGTGTGTGTGAGADATGTGAEAGTGTGATGTETETGTGTDGTGTGAGAGTDGAGTGTNVTGTGTGAGTGTNGTGAEAGTETGVTGTGTETETGTDKKTENTDAEENTELTQETHTVDMPEYQTGPSLTVEELEEEPAGETDISEDSTDVTIGSVDMEPVIIEPITIEGVTWESSPVYDGNTAGIYTFTPILPDSYALAEGVSLPEITVTVTGESEQAGELDALLMLLRALPEPENYLTYDEAADKITTHSEIIDEEQLREAREAADKYLEKYPDSDKNVTCGADIDNNRDENAPSGEPAGTTEPKTDAPSGEPAGTTEPKTSASAQKASDESAETLASLLTRLEALEHIRDTKTDCTDLDCVYHYPQFVKERMEENEVPELLTMEDLVEDFGIEEPEQSPAQVSEGAPARRSKARAAASKLYPETLMQTSDNENNAHTGAADGDIDRTRMLSDGNHPVEISFNLKELPVQSAYLAVKAYDVDEESGEHDYVYINDDIYKPMDQIFISNLLGAKTYYNSSNIGYLSGTDETWNVTVLKIPLEKLVKGKNVISITVANTWCMQIDWMQLILDGGKADTNVESFSLKLSDVKESNDKDNVTVHADVTVKQKGSTKYITEYMLTKEDTGDALDACFGSAQTKESISFTMKKSLDTGTYRITGLLKDPKTEQIKAMDSVSFYFIKGEGVGPKVSHTLTPDTLTNGSVTIQVQAEATPDITNVTVPSPRTVTANSRYGFTVEYQINSSKKSFTYYVTVDNIDKVPPVITYKPLTVPEDTPQADVKTQFQASLSASDDRKLADNPFTWTLPANISYLPGTKNVTVKAADAAGNIRTQTCKVNVTAKPLQLTMKEPVAVSGSRDSFALKAVLTNTGADTITKTGFVWGVMPNPTLEVKNGSAATASPVKTKGAALSAAATGIAYGVTYYARAYATLQNGSTIYSDSKQFGSGLPAYGTFNISKVSGSTFTISRTGGTDGKQTVYYRTVNGSAIGGTHFTHKTGSLVFADGEASKTVTVSEKGVTTAYNGKAATSYSNADRTYFLEIYRVDGGGTLGKTVNATRKMTKNDNYAVSPSIYTTEHERDVAVNSNNKWVADRSKTPDGKGSWWRQIFFVNDRGKNAGQGYKNFNVQRTMDVGNARENAYLMDTATGYSYRLELSATETDNGYEHVWISNHAPNSLYGHNTDNHSDYEAIPLDYSDFGHAYYTGRWEINYQDIGNVSAVGFPSESGLIPGKGLGRNNPYRYKDNSRISGGWVLYDLKDTAHVWFAADGNKKNVWYLNSYTDYVKVRDSREPQCIGVAPMAGGTYLPDDDITVALVFDEIVDKTKSAGISNVSIETNVGTLAYAGGADTNVLYFTGKVKSGASLNGSGALEVTKVINSANIKDMCDDKGSSTPSYSGSTNVSVDASKPDLAITGLTKGALPQHKAKVTSSENSVRYAWTKSSAMPAAGWQTLSGAKSGVTLTERRGSAGKTETWYLHVVATASSGASNHIYKSFTFMQPDITSVSVRAGSTTDYEDVSDVWKTGKYIVAEYAGGADQRRGTCLCRTGDVYADDYRRIGREIPESDKERNLYAHPDGRL